MAELPDLDTSQIEFLAYWNAISDGGVSTIDPSEVTSDGNINSQTLYDNGIHIGDYSNTEDRSIEARVKNDGWLVAFMDRTRNFDQNATSPPRGYWDLSNGWTRSTTGNYQYNSLERAINSLASQFSNWGAMTYNVSDVGLYNYRYQDATASTGMSTQYGDQTYTGGFSYTSGTEIKAAVAHGNGAASNNRQWKYEFEGVTAATQSDQQGYGALDILNQGLIPNENTEYQGTTDPSSYGSAKGEALVVWK